MAGGAQKDDDEIISDINVTPLVDVVLVLLIILMVTATAIANGQIDVELPNASTSNQQQTEEPTTLALSLDARGDLYIDETKITRAELVSRANAARRADPRTRATIAADTSVPHGRVIDVIDALREAQVVKFAFRVRPSELGGSRP